ncbi:hypothetical protein HGRIS_001593 [Hohenbuehelia grisea]|uniref:Uncharacterized protein n=1 Tax=Hohenbuehelia grisea TaxID=104357 RepID=A0ABR3JI96_9AGAR
MPLPQITYSILEHFTNHQPATEDAWYGPWNTILTMLFPAADGFVVTPQRRIPGDNESTIPDFVIEVVKTIIGPPPSVTFRTVLIVEVKNSQHWPFGIPALDRQLSRQTDAAFAGTAVAKVYWIGSIGPHWRYGVKQDDGQQPQSLTGWHDVIHDEGSWQDLEELARLVRDM